MSVPLIQTAFVTGEVSPALYGHTDLARMHSAAATMRNLFVGYRGGAYSRAGTAFVGFSRQTGRSVPPRMIPFQFNINQGLGLEFGNFYMRVIKNGAFVTENLVLITNVTRANPGVITLGAGLTSVTVNTGGVTATYAPGDHVTLAGGTFTTPAVVNVDATEIVSLAVNAAGTNNYAPGDSIALAGGVFSTIAHVAVGQTKIVAVTVQNGGFGGTPGVWSGFVLSGLPAANRGSFSVTIGGGGGITAISISNPGAYSANPDNLANATLVIPGAGGSDYRVSLAMGVLSVALTNGGVFSTNPAGGNLTQLVTTGSGVGATFQSALMAPVAVSFFNAGQYSVVPPSPAAQASTTGSGVGATFNVTGGVSIANGDWFELTGIGGMMQLNGRTVVAANVSGLSFQLSDVYGSAIDTTGFTAFTAGGTAARIFTLVTPYAEADLEFIKIAESADVMSLTCVNQETGAEYPPQDLTRLSDINWQISAVVPAPTISPPTGAAASFSSAGAAAYAYVVTAINPSDGTESVASNIAATSAAVNIATTAGSIFTLWNAIPGVNEYNVYKAEPVISNLGATPVPAGALYGFAGTAYGTSFVDSNIVPDFAQVPPLAKNPFARGAIIGAVVSAPGSAYTSISFAITTSSGTGAVLEGVLAGGLLVAVIVRSGGQNYKAGDTVTVSGAGGSGAAVNLTIGAQTGTYPGVVTYFQERRGYAYTLNNPDTYFFTQPGAFTNMDSRIPTIDSDAIIGSPWATQVNGIQWMIPTTGGLLVFTGLQAWLLVGAGGFATNVGALTPAQQTATPQPEIGCSPTLQPIKINYDVIFADSNSSIYYDQPYQLYALSEPLDLTENSAHLFTGYTFREHAWCRRPFKVIWTARDDGALLSLTWLKAQQVAGWARHDTQGLFQSTCAVFEPPVDALYLATQRFPPGKNAYMIERMDDRLWRTVEDVWAVDCALSLPQPAPAATLTVSSATGLGAVTGVTGLVGGSGYSAGTTAAVVDDNGAGPGTGASPALTIIAGVITAVTFAGGNQGTLYTYPKISVTDPAGSAGGSGFSATCVLSNTATFTSSPGVFSAPNVGNVIRAAGGIATITVFTNSTTVTVQITDPLSAIPGTNGVVAPIASGDWTMTAPVNSVGGGIHLAGMTVTGLADGSVIPPAVMPASGVLPLANPATSVVVGLAYQPQLQSVYIDTGQPTVQGQRKKVSDVTIRVESSRGLKVGTNNPDGSTLSPAQLAPVWNQMKDASFVPNQGNLFQRPPYNSTRPILETGDTRQVALGGFNTKAQVGVQQDLPYPMNILAFINDIAPGDLAQTTWPKTETRGKGR